jgi:hypothetical protein
VTGDLNRDETSANASSRLLYFSTEGEVIGSLPTPSLIS